MNSGRPRDIVVPGRKGISLLLISSLNPMDMLIIIHGIAGTIPGRFGL